VALEHTNSKPGLPERVVLIGAGGFVGQVLSAQLSSEKVSVVSVSSKDVDLSTAGSDEILASMIKEGDAVVVLAAITPDKGRGVEPFIQNINIAANTAKALNASNPSHVVYLSSDAVYSMDEALITEETPAEATDLYGAMHLSRELLFKSEIDAPVAVVRPTLIFGADDTHNSYGPNRLRRMARDKGKITLFGGGEETRDHIYVADVARLIVEVLKHKSKGLLNIATGQSVTYHELAHQVAALFDGNVDVELTERQNPITYRKFDVVALQKAFPHFKFTSLNDGLAEAHAGMIAGAE
jgi:UDP-glucose 4-epimerase